MLSHFRDTRSDIIVIPKDDKYLIVNFVKHYKCDNRYLVCRILETIVYIFLNVRQPGNLVMCAWRGLAMPRINFRVCAGSETPQISLQGWLNPKTNFNFSENRCCLINNTEKASHVSTMQVTALRDSDHAQRLALYVATSRGCGRRIQAVGSRALHPAPDRDGGRLQDRALNWGKNWTSSACQNC